MDLIGDARCWYTAHTREVAAKLFRDEWAPMLDPLARLYRLRKSQGSEGVHKRRGSSRLQLFAPNAGGVALDERRHRHRRRSVGVRHRRRRSGRGRHPPRPAHPAVAPDVDRLRRRHDRSRPGGTAGSAPASRPPRASPCSTSVPTRPPPTTTRRTRRSGRRRIRPPAVAFPLDVLADEWNTRRTDADFERAYLNVWPRPSQVAAAGAGLDRRVVRGRPPRRARPAGAGDRRRRRRRPVPRRDRRRRLGDGDVLVVEVVDARPGIGWVAGAVRDARRRPSRRRRRRRLARRRVDRRRAEPGAVVVDPLGAADHAQACGTFVDLLAAGRLSHRAQAVLDDAVAGAARRPLGDAWLWSRSRSGVDISPLVAVTLAACARAHPPTRRSAPPSSSPNRPTGGVGTRRPAPRPAHGTTAPHPFLVTRNAVYDGTDGTGARLADRPARGPPAHRGARGERRPRPDRHRTRRSTRPAVRAAARAWCRSNGRARRRRGGTATAAMSLPTISRCRDLICSRGRPRCRSPPGVSTDRRPTGRDRVTAPRWMERPDPDRTRQWLLAWTVDDLFFYGDAHWLVTARYAGNDDYPSAFRRLYPGELGVDDDGRATVNGQPVDPRDIVEFLSPDRRAPGERLPGHLDRRRRSTTPPTGSPAPRCPPASSRNRTAARTCPPTTWPSSRDVHRGPPVEHDRGDEQVPQVPRDRP